MEKRVKLKLRLSVSTAGFKEEKKVQRINPTVIPSFGWKNEVAVAVVAAAVTAVFSSHCR